MTEVPEYEIRVFGNDDELPAEAEELFASQLAYSRSPEVDKRAWRFALVCAVTTGGRVLGGVHLDIGPIATTGPVGHEKLAYLERTLVREEYRRQGVATAALKAAVALARDAGCQYIRCHNDWDNPAETALFRRCGFALVDLTGDQEDHPSYLAIRCLQNLD